MPRRSSKERLRQFFRDNIGKVVTSKQLQEAAGPNVTEWARRVRELRNDEGWPIATNNDDSGLKPGEYRLTSAPPSDGDYQFSRGISGRIRAQVLERNGYTCQMCGAAPGELSEHGRKIRLQIGHIVDRSHGGKDDLPNLRALCSDCNEGAKNIAAEPPSWTWLLAQIRRATLSDQQKALEWLQTKFHTPPAHPKC